MGLGSNFIWFQGHGLVSPSFPPLLCNVVSVSVHMLVSVSGLYSVLYLFIVHQCHPDLVTIPL